MDAKAFSMMPWRECDEVDKAYVAFAHSLARAAAVATEGCLCRKFVERNVPRLLTSILNCSDSGDIISGSLTLALSQLCLIGDDSVLEAATEAGAVPLCVRLIDEGGDDSMTVQMCCKTLAALAVLPRNKALMSGKRAIGALVRLLERSIVAAPKKAEDDDDNDSEAEDIPPSQTDDIFPNLETDKDSGKIAPIADDQTVAYALFALCNSAAGSDANRSVLLGNNIFNIVESILEQRSDCGRPSDVVLGAARLVSNLSHRSERASFECLGSKCVQHLVKAAAATMTAALPPREEDEAKVAECNSSTNTDAATATATVSSPAPAPSTPPTAAAAAAARVRTAVSDAIANLSNSSSNRALLDGGGLPKVVRPFLQESLRSSEDLPELMSAAIACAALSYRSTKVRTDMGREGFVEALIDVILCKGYGDDNEGEESKAAEASCRALVCLLAQRTNRDSLAEQEAEAEESKEDGKGNDLVELVELLCVTESMKVLEAGAMTIATLVPRERERARTALGLEGRTSAVEAAGGERVLTRCKQWLYSWAEYGGPAPPRWLTRALSLVQMTEQEAADIVRRCGADEGGNDQENDSGSGREVKAGQLESVEPDEYFPQSILFKELTALPEMIGPNMLPT